MVRTSDKLFTRRLSYAVVECVRDIAGHLGGLWSVS